MRSDGSLYDESHLIIFNNKTFCSNYFLAQNPYYSWRNLCFHMFKFTVSAYYERLPAMAHVTQDYKNEGIRLD